MSTSRGGARLATYVSPLCASIAWSGDDVVRLDAAVLFADISGFTRLGERLARSGRSGAEALSRVISDCFGALIDEVVRHGGDVVRFGGDAMCICFPGDPRHSAHRAAQCAAALQRSMRAVGRVAAGERTVRLRMSIGLDAGAVVFVRQPGRHGDVVPLGPVVSGALAAEAKAEAGEVRLGAGTVAALPSAWRCSADDDRLEVRAVDEWHGAVDRLRVPSAATARMLLGDALSRFVVTRGAEYRVATVAFVGIGGTDRQCAPGRADALVALATTVGRVLDEVTAVFGVELLATDVAPDGWKLVLAAGVPDAASDDDARLLAATRMIVESVGDVAHGGVQRGTVFLGAVGHPDRRTITVMGDVVNTAARLMGAAPPGRVVAAEDVVERAGAAVRAEWLAPLRLKGKQREVRAAVVHSATPTFNDRFRRPDGFVGRGAELGLVRTALRDARTSGHGSVLDIVGAAGSGTSALMRAALDGVTPVLRVHGDPFARTDAFGALRAPLRWVVGADDAGELRRGWQQRLRAAVPHLGEALAVVASVLDPVATMPARLARVDASGRGELVAAAIVAVVAGCAPSGLVVAVDDVQWLDASSRSVLDRLAVEAPDRGWVLVVARRDDADAWAPPSVSRRIRLRRLGDTETRRLVAWVARDSDVDDATIDAVVERVHGNPARARALAAAAVQGDDPRAAPDAIEAVPVAQLERASGPARSFLAAAAVLGTQAPVPVLAALLGVTPERTVATARSLAWAVGTDGASVWFHERLVHDVVVARLPVARRRALHSAVLAFAQERPGVLDASRLVAHAVEARDDDVVVAHAPGAAQRALRSGAVHEAVVLLEATLAAMRRRGAPTADQLAVVHVVTPLLDGIGRRADAQHLLRWALRHTDTAASAVPTAVDLARSLMRDDRVSLALRVLTQTQRRFTRLPVRLGDRLELARADVWMHSGRHAASASRARAVAQRAAARGDDRLHARALLSLEYAATSLGDPRVVELGEQALAALRSTRQWRERAIALANVAVTADNAGDWPRALRHYGQAERALADLGELGGVALVRLNRATIATELGDLDGIDDLLADVRRELTALRYPRAVPVVDAAAARAAARRGTLDPIVAARRIRTAAALVSTDDELQAAFLAAWAVEADLLAGAPRRALRHLASVREVAHRLGPDTLLPVTVGRLEAWALAQRGSTARAREGARTAALVASERGLEPERCFASSLCAAIDGRAPAGLLGAQRRLGVVSTPIGRAPVRGLVHRAATPRADG